MGWWLPGGGPGSASRARPRPGLSRAPPCRSSLFTVLLVLLLLSWPGGARAMGPGRVAKLRRETVDMFYHGYDNYMKIAFPEDEVRLKPTATRTASDGC